MDNIFLYFIKGLFVIILLFGIGMVVVILFGNQSIGLRMVSTFGAMFAGILGLGSGYILGHTVGNTARQDEAEGKEDSHDGP